MNDLTRNQKLETEKKILLKTKKMVIKELQLSVGKIDAFTLDKMNKLICRMIDNEIDFLYDETEEYFELYCKNHLNN